MDVRSFVQNLSGNNVVDQQDSFAAVAKTIALLQLADAEWQRAVANELADKVITVGDQTFIDPLLISDARMTERYNNQTLSRPVIDIVQQGGGMYGIALAGYCYIIEKSGLRFNSLGGTSSGGISTMLLGAIPNTIYTQNSIFSSSNQALKSELIAHIIANTAFSKFLERRGIVGRLQQKFLRHFSMKLLRKVLLVTAIMMTICYLMFSFVFHTNYGIVSNELRLYDYILGTLIAIMPAVLMYILLVRILGRNFGINSGQRFYKWMEDILTDPQIGIKSNQDLEERLKQTEFEIDGIPAGEHPKMVLITANLTHNRIVKFPDAASDYWGDSSPGVGPAAFVRATMSIPFIFDTFIPDANHVNAGLKAIKMKARFVDGGLLSNFPIREFHTRWDVKPRFPTFGVLLNENTSEGKGVPPAAAKPEPFPPVSLGKFIVSFFSTFRNFYDNDFLYQNDEIRLRIETVNTKGFNWLNFWMSDADKQQLFAEGVRAAIRQLEKFNWSEYKKLR